jgi:hypothetical protein
VKKVPVKTGWSDRRIAPCIMDVIFEALQTFPNFSEDIMGACACQEEGTDTISSNV